MRKQGTGADVKSQTQRRKPGKFRPVYADATENLRLLCRELNLPVEDALPWLQLIASELSWSETLGESPNKSAPVRQKDLQRVAIQSRRLWNTINSLDHGDLRILNGFLGQADARIALETPDQLREAFKPSIALVGVDQVYLLGDLLLTLAGLADQAEKLVKGSREGGRPSEEGRAANRIYPIARFAHHYAIPFGRSKKFLLLCSAVFHAAGLDVNPEPGIRQFAKVAPDLKRTWATETDEYGADVRGNNPTQKR